MTSTSPADGKAGRPRDPVMRWLVAGTVLCTIACAVLVGMRGSTAVTATGIALGGTAFVGVLSIAFYAIGRSEDRERAEREARRDGQP